MLVILALQLTLDFDNSIRVKPQVLFQVGAKVFSAQHGNNMGIPFDCPMFRGKPPSEDGSILDTNQVTR